GKLERIRFQLVQFLRIAIGKNDAQITGVFECVHGLILRTILTNQLAPGTRHIFRLCNIRLFRLARPGLALSALSICSTKAEWQQKVTGELERANHAPSIRSLIREIREIRGHYRDLD